MDKKDRNTKPGDSEIVTKKGFLITPPKRTKDKKQDTIESNIKPAVTVNKNSEEKKQGGNQEQKKHEKNNHQKDRRKFGKKPHQSAHTVEEQAQQPKDNSQKNQNNQQPRHKPSKYRNEKPNHDQRQDNQNKSKNDRQQNRKDRDRTGKQPQQNRNDQHGQSQQNREKDRERDKKNRGAGKIDPSILSDLGFVSNNYAKSRPVEESTETETSQPFDYSNAIPLRDQIYPPKKEKKDLTEEEKQGKTEIIGIRFKEAGKIYYFDPNGEQVDFGTPVIVETARGLEYGYTAIGNRYIPTDTIVSPLKKIIRIAKREDTERLEANKRLEKQAESVFIEKVAKLGLEMSLVGVEYTFDNTKILFYFAAENRIDFRELVKELASVFRTRIELRQVGVRDEAKMLGGLGVCGRPLCCSTFLGEFAQVSIKMAKDQSLSLNSSKISGTCGRLLCCLRYEDEVYQQEFERTPKVDAIVETEEGRGVVVETNPLKGIVRVRLDSNKDAPPHAFHRDKVKILGYIKKNESVDAELKALEKE
ncbi:MAG: hypothetical protein E7656_02160 [Ruminococcaceae bacterium]|nr:hypothetical protein [Oscillospiraceae bacterium]